MSTLLATDAGYQDMMDVYFRGATPPTAFALRLVNDTVVGTDNWADVLANELPSANGYVTGGVTIERSAVGFPTLALDSGDMQIESKEVSWTASGNWATAITALCLVADKGTDQLVAYSNITSITPQTDDVVAWVLKFKLKKTCA
jgi:hypothetical protein